MKIFAKLIGAFGVVALICAIVGIIGWYGISSTESDLVDVGEQHLPAVQGLGLAMEHMNAIKSGERTLLDPMLTKEERSSEIAKTKERWEELIKGVEEYEKTENDPAEEVEWLKAKDELAIWKRAHEEFIAAISRIDTEMQVTSKTAADNDDLTLLKQAREIAYGPLRTAFYNLDERLGTVQDMSRKAAGLQTDEAEESAASMRMLAIVSVIFAVIASMSFGFLIARSISRPMEQGRASGRRDRQGGFQYPAELGSQG